MSASNQGWNLLSGHADKKRPEEIGFSQEDRFQRPEVVPQADRWIWGVWIAVALLSVAILPFATRMGEVARAIAQFCGFPM